MYNPVFYTGVVEDVMDPLELGRARVRVFGIHSLDETDIPTSSLPWASTLAPVTAASGGGAGWTPHFIPFYTWVLVYFLDGEDKQQPLIMGTLPGITNEQHTYSVNGQEVSLPGTNAKEAQGTASDAGNQVVSYDEFGNPITQAQLEGDVPLSAFGDGGVTVTDVASNAAQRPGESVLDYQDRVRKTTGNNNLQYGGNLDEVFTDDSGQNRSPNRPGENT